MKPADVSAILNIPFVQIALRVMLTIAIASWRKAKRFDQVIDRLDGINTKLSDFAQRIVRLEERTSPLAL